MKNCALKAVTLVAALIILACCLTSCNRLSGVYVSQEDFMYTTYEFSPFSDKMIVTIAGIPISATYEIEEDKIYITMAGDREEHSFSKKGKTIYIDDKAFVKE